MNRLLPILQKAKSSGFYLWLLNTIMLRVIPFNGPHRFKILKISDDQIVIRMPYQRKNLNHLKGLHACGLAAVAEYASGLLLISRIDPARYRLIMQSMNVEFYYQGKMDGIATFTLPDDWVQEQVIKPLESEDAIIVSPEIEVHDTDGNHLMTNRVNWQVKRWDKVRTAVNA